MSSPILISSDHAAVELKGFIQKVLPNYPWLDLGPLDTQRVDYPDYAEKLASEVSTGKVERGILICGSGIGMCIAANKFPGIRAAVVESVESAKLSREHNDANILCLGARILDPETAVKIVRVWLETAFTKDLRHVGRITKIAQLEQKLNDARKTEKA